MGCDILIIGGGINGVACAREIGRNHPGESCLLIEQAPELAQGTSSRSSKLIHGGLRYLETLNFGLVRESLQAQKALLRDYPDLVRWVPFYIPIYTHTHRRPWQICTGLTLYRLLGSRPFRKLQKNDWPLQTGLKEEGLQAVYQYWDAQTDDAMLTRTVMQEAINHGVQCWKNCSLESATITQKGWRVQLRRDGEEQTIQCRTIINAAGPWVNIVLEKFEPVPEKLPLDLVAGTHILLPIPEGFQKDAGLFYVEAPQDQRAVFVMPWQGHLMIGTTERIYAGDPAYISPTAEEIDYLLEVYHSCFDSSAQKNDIEQAFAGLRVLPGSNGRAFTASREVRIHQSAPDLISIYGGKLTTHRETARKVLKQLYTK